MSVGVRFVTAAEELELCFDLRRRVFEIEQAIPKELEFDGLDAEADHLLASEGRLALGTLRRRRLGDVVKVERVCVAAEARGTGLGARMMRVVIEAARADPSARLVKLVAQCSVEGFYARLGFRPVGDVFDDAGIPHIGMILEMGAP